MQKLWSESEINYLKENYKTLPVKDIACTLDRTVASITNAAQFYKLTTSRKTTDVSFLLNDSMESFYWIGFLLADGTFTDGGNVVKLKLADKDENHLLKLSNKLNTVLRRGITDGKYGYSSHCTISAYDTTKVPEIMQKFLIQLNKTYNPPPINRYNFPIKLMISMIIGIIDGDGCISKSNKGHKISIESHSSWYDNLSIINEILHTYFQYTISNNVFINGRGFSVISIGKTSLVKDLKNFAIENNIPILERKWLHV